MLRRDEDAVASTVATIFTLLLITLFFSLVIGEAVPRLGREAEWVHYNEIRGAFDRLQALLALQLEAAVLQSSQTPGRGSIVSSSGFSLGAPGMPVFGSPTVDALRVEPGRSVVDLEFDFRSGGFGFEALEPSEGVLELDLGNRYLPRMTLSFENGALVLVQADGSVTVEGPPLEVGPRTANGSLVRYRRTTLVGDRFEVSSSAPVLLTVETLAGDRQVLNIADRTGALSIEDIRALVLQIKEEVREASRDGRVRGSYADVGGSEGIINQGLTEQLVYYDNALIKLQIPDCAGAANDMEDSADQLLLNVMNKIVEGIATGYIEPAYGWDLHQRLDGIRTRLLQIRDQLRVSCEAYYASLQGSGGNLVFFLKSDLKEAWRAWFRDYLTSLPSADWSIARVESGYVVHLRGVDQLVLETAYVELSVG